MLGALDDCAFEDVKGEAVCYFFGYRILKVISVMKKGKSNRDTYLNNV